MSARYWTLAQAAERWGVTLRQAQRLAPRVPGAARHGRAWMLPADSVKPGDPRRASAAPPARPEMPARKPAPPLYEPLRPEPTIRPAYSPRFSCALLCDVLRFTSGGAEDVLSRAGGPEERMQAEAELCYLRGDFDGAIERTIEGDPESPLRLSALLLLSLASINAGDIACYLRAEKELTTLRRECAGDESACRAVELAQACVALTLGSPYSCADWLKEGDLNLIPFAHRPFAVLMYAQYLLATGQFSRLLAIAETTLLFVRQDTYTISEIYLYLMCVAGFSQQRRMDAARTTLRTALGLALPDGFIAPFAELYEPIRTTLESLLRREYPDHVAPVLALRRRIGAHRAAVRERYLREQLSRLITPREHQMALLAAQGIGNEEIARRLGLSVNHVRSSLQNVFARLGVHSRQALRQYL